MRVVQFQRLLSINLLYRIRCRKMFFFYCLFFFGGGGVKSYPRYPQKYKEDWQYVCIKNNQTFYFYYLHLAPVPQEESQLIYQRSSNEDIKFHSFHDSDILLKENGTLAIRHCLGGDGICLTNRPLKIGEKIHIRIVVWSFHNYSTVYSHFNSINIGTTSIPPERIFDAKNVKEAIMGRLNYIKPPCQCCNEGDLNRWFAHPFHICISLCRNGSLLVCCENTQKYYPPYPDDPINTPLWLVIKFNYCGSVWISHA